MRTTIVKKMAAVGTGLAFMGATLMGALAADLANYPGMFLKDNKFNAAIVVGDNAAASDVVGSIDLAASLQYAARTEKQVSVGGTTTVSASAGVEVAATGNHLTLHETLSTVESSFKKDDLPTLLADGIVEDDSSGDDWDYDQELTPAADAVAFANPDDDVFGDNPGLYLDHSTGKAYTLTVDIDGDDLNATALDDSEKIVILGKTFTFDPEMEGDSTVLTFYASEKTETISVGETKTVTLKDGTSITVELVGANSDAETATIRVDGKSYSKESGDTITVSGTQLYINDVFTYNIPAPGAAIEFFVGSDKVEINGDGGWNDVEIDDDPLSTVQAKITSGDIEAIDEILFNVTPSEEELAQYKYLQLNEEYVDPLFGTMKMKFAGVTPELKDADKTKISLTRSGDDYKLAFVNKDADAYEFTLYHSDGATVTYDEDFAGATENVSDDNIFILPETDVTKVYKLISVADDGGVDKATIRDLTDNTDFKVKDGDEIGDTNVIAVNVVDAATDYIELDDNTSLEIITQFDGVLTIDAADLTFAEVDDNFDDLVAGDVAEIQINISAASDDGDEDITIAGLEIDAANIDNEQDEDGNIEYGVSEYGTYYEYEVDNNGAYVDIYFPEEEQGFHVFFMPTAATTSTQAGGQTVTYYEYNKIEVGAAKLASEITNVAAQNLIVVGGPCANSVAATLTGNKANCAEGFEEGNAILQLVENGANVALLVAGYSAEDTRRATAVLANYDDYALAGMGMVVKGTSMTDITVSASQ